MIAQKRSRRYDVYDSFEDPKETNRKEEAHLLREKQRKRTEERLEKEARKKKVIEYEERSRQIRNGSATTKSSKDRFHGDRYNANHDERDNAQNRKTTPNGRHSRSYDARSSSKHEPTAAVIDDSFHGFPPHDAYDQNYQNHHNGYVPAHHYGHHYDGNLVAQCDENQGHDDDAHLRATPSSTHSRKRSPQKPPRPKGLNVVTGKYPGCATVAIVDLSGTLSSEKLKEELDHLIKTRRKPLRPPIRSNFSLEFEECGDYNYGLSAAAPSHPTIPLVTPQKASDHHTESWHSSTEHAQRYRGGNALTQMDPVPIRNTKCSVSVQTEVVNESPLRSLAASSATNSHNSNNQKMEHIPVPPRSTTSRDHHPHPAVPGPSIDSEQLEHQQRATTQTNSRKQKFGGFLPHSDTRSVSKPNLMSNSKTESPSQSRPQSHRNSQPQSQPQSRSHSQSQSQSAGTGTSGSKFKSDPQSFGGALSLNPRDDADDRKSKEPEFVSKRSWTDINDVDTFSEELDGPVDPYAAEQKEDGHPDDQQDLERKVEVEPSPAVEETVVAEVTNDVRKMVLENVMDLGASLEDGSGLQVQEVEEYIQSGDNSQHSRQSKKGNKRKRNGKGKSGNEMHPMDRENWRDQPRRKSNRAKRGSRTSNTKHREDRRYREEEQDYYEGEYHGGYYEDGGYGQDVGYYRNDHRSRGRAVRSSGNQGSRSRNGRYQGQTSQSGSKNYKNRGKRNVSGPARKRNTTSQRDEDYDDDYY